MDQLPLELATIVSAPFAENSYIAWREGRDDCLVFDPGFEPDKIVESLDERGLTPAALMLTHGHPDHIAGNEFLRRRWPACPIVIYRDEAPKLTDPRLNLSASFGVPLVSPPADILLDENATHSAAGFDLETRLTPGHSTGHIVYVWKGATPWIVFGGDVLFAGSIGRTDLPDGSFEQLKDAIHRHLFTLPDDTIVLPGHGPATTVGREKRSNPFVGRRAGYDV